MKRWFQIQNAASTEAATVTIFDEIGLWGITAADFNREFRAIQAPIINLEINSPGGSVFDGLAIYNMLRGSGKTINAKVMGVAASIASVILMAADKITMPENAMVMVHSPMGGVFGTADEMREMADVLDKVKTSLVATYVKRTGKSEEEITAMLAKDTWMTAAEAKDSGFADEVTDSLELTAKFEMDDRIPEAARAVFKAAAKPPVPAPQPTPAPVAAAPFAEQVVALATAAGFEAHAPQWALEFTELAAVEARISEARDIRALCAAVKKDDTASDFIAGKKTLAEVRAALTDLIAEGDQHVDTTKPNSNQPPVQGPAAVTTAGIWAKRNKQLAGAK